MAGFIKLSRQMLEWGWYKDANTKSLWIHLLFEANWKDGEFMGYKIPRGSLATSIGHLAKETGLSVKNVRTGIEHLRLTGEISVKPTNKFTIITVEKYDVYQLDDSEGGKQVANKRQTSGKQVATIEEGKKVRREEDRERTLF